MAAQIRCTTTVFTKERGDGGTWSGSYGQSLDVEVETGSRTEVLLVVRLKWFCVWPIAEYSMTTDFRDRQQLRSISVNTWMCVCVFLPWACSSYFFHMLLQ